MTTVDHQSELISENPFVNQCKDKRGDDGCRFTGFVSICAVTPVSPVCPQTHTKVYLYRWEYECRDVCLCVSVVYCKRGLESATPCSRCRAEAAVLAQAGLCCRPAGRAARRACCTAGTLSSPPTTWWGTFYERHVCMDKSPARLSVWTLPSILHISHANLALWLFPSEWLVCMHIALCAPGAVTLLSSSRRGGWGWRQRWLSQTPQCRY